MRQIIEFSMFLAGATVLHLAVGYVAPSGTQSGAGAGGDAPVTLAAANVGLQDMIAEWDQPVEVVQQVAQPVPNAPEMAPAFMPNPDRAAPERPALQRPLAGDAPSLPEIDQTTAPKPKLAEHRPKLRPAAKTAVKAKPLQAKQTPAAKPEQKKSASATSPQKAAGAGTRKPTKGAGTGAAPKAKASGNSQNLMASWGGQIRSSIERRKRYPAGTRASGTVTLAISVHARGAIVGVSVIQSSGVPQLDRAAMSAVKSARIAAAPKGLGAGVHKFTIPMKFAP
jgi:protein TonB